MTKIMHRRKQPQNLDPDRSQGGLTKAVAARMGKGMAGQPVKCTITGHCRTVILEFPGSHLITGGAVDHQLIWSQGGCRATVVADLLTYFERESTDWVHYNIDVSLRAGVRRTNERSKEQAKRSARPIEPLYLVIEQQEQVSPTVLDDGVCFAVDEIRNGTEHIEGGRRGEKALIAIRTCDGTWPTFEPDTQMVHIVLAAVRAEQNFLERFKELYSCSCYVSSDGQAVYGMGGTLTAILKQTAPLEVPELREKGDRIRSLLQGMMADSTLIDSELCDSFALDKPKDTGRLSYLDLWESLKDAGKHLNIPQFTNHKKIIAGGSTPKELTDYRNAITHQGINKIDSSRLRDLKLTALELIRRKYRTPQ